MTDDIPTIDFTLPGQWWRVPLDDADTVGRSARSLALETFGRADELTQLRRELTEEITRAAEAARSTRAQDFYFAREIVPGARVPLAMTVTWPDLPWLPSRAHPSTAATELEKSLSGTSSPGDIDVLSREMVGVVRQVRVFPAAGTADVPTPGRLQATYWILSPTTSRALALLFSTPLVEFREPVLALSDAIVESVRFRQTDFQPQH